MASEPKGPIENHEWPVSQAEHVWGEWTQRTALPKATQYRSCIHPRCGAFETREAPK